MNCILIRMSDVPRWGNGYPHLPCRPAWQVCGFESRKALSLPAPVGTFLAPSLAAYKEPLTFADHSLENKLHGLRHMMVTDDMLIEIIRR